MTALETNLTQQRHEMAALMQSTDWSRTSLGPPDRWPQSLRSALSICTGSAFPIAIYWGPDLALVYNGAWSPILGQKHPWAFGRAAREVWPELWDRIGPQLDLVMTTGEATYQEDALLPMRRHGYTEECYFNVTFSPIRGESGRVEGIFNAVVETTYRVVSERRARVLRDLAEQIARARSSAETCTLAAQSLASATSDVPFCAIYLVESAAPRARLVATAGLEWGGAAAPAVVSLTDDAAAWPFAELWRRPRVEIVTNLGERLGVALPGGAAPESASAALVAPILAASGTQPLGFAVIGASPRRAIDDQYQHFAERAASLIAAVFTNVKSHEDERARLEAMFEESPAAIIVLRGTDLVVEVANAHAIEMSGRRVADVVGKPLTEAIPELRGQGFDDQLRGVIQTGTPAHGKAVLVRVDRGGTGALTDQYFDFVFAPLRDPDGTVGGVFIHAFDVTELVNERRAAENANRMKDEFLATMSHELRTPLHAILGWATLLRTGMGHHSEAARDKALATIERNARTQARLIDDILDVSRIISGKLRLDIKRHEVAAIINEAVEIVRPAATAKEIDLVVRIDDSAGFISGDFERLQQVVWNLLINAIRFTPVRGKVTVEAARVKSNVVLRVSDTGVGIAPEHVRQVFERFRQVDSSTTRKHGGLGLGLAIVRHLVELHGGTVEAESEGEGKGSMFTVSLPVRATAAPEADDVERPASTPRPRRSEGGRLDGLHVVVADDDEDSRDLIASALEGAGATVTTVDSAPAAFESIEHCRPSLLISDIGMPGEDGYSLIRRVRALPAESGGNVPAIALTAYARPEDERVALAAGYGCHLAKPVDPIRLTEAVARLAQARGQPSAVATASCSEPTRQA